VIRETWKGGEKKKQGQEFSKRWGKKIKGMPDLKKFGVIFSQRIGGGKNRKYLKDPTERREQKTTREGDKDSLGNAGVTRRPEEGSPR